MTATRPRGRAAATLAPEFYARPAAQVAPELLGCLLVSVFGQERTAGRIVETEAYPGPDDPASHAWSRIGRTPRNDPLYGPPGIAYIHLNYGIHWCFNAVVAEEGVPEAVLIRALEPVEGVELMRSRRRGRRDLTNGPARLTEALGIGPQIQRHRLDRPPVWLEAGERVPEERLVRTTRIGITRGSDLELRFCDGASAWVSRR